ncbi:MAG: hypothetical protein MI861_14975, partial [Pirellulales bacterium]|nr:hypothetical protein [Pirellulales bacterium]
EEIFGVDAEPAVVQVPVVQAKRAEVARELPLGQAVLIDPYIKRTLPPRQEENVSVLKRFSNLRRGLNNAESKTREAFVMVILQPRIER